MSAYNPPEKNLAIFDPSVFTSSGNDALTQADTRYLRFPNAQGTENLLDINVNGTATFLDDVVIKNASNNTSTLYVDDTTSDLKIDCNVGSVNIIPRLNTDSQIYSGNHIHTSSTNYTQRQIFSSYYNFYDGTTGVTALNQTGRIFCLNTSCFFDMTILNNSSINFRCKVNNTNYTPLILTDQIVAQRNLVFNTASSIIDQTNILADTGNYNVLKRTEIRVNNGGSSNNGVALDIYDSNSLNGRGIRFIADAFSGSYNGLTENTDSVIVNRYRPSSTPVGLVVGLNDAGATGIRFRSNATGKGFITLGAGTTNKTYMYDDTGSTPNSTLFEGSITMSGTTNTRRSISNVSTLNFRDIDGFGYPSYIYSSSSIGALRYDIEDSTWKHSFRVFDNSQYSERLSISATGVSINFADGTQTNAFTSVYVGKFNAIGTLVYATMPTTPLTLTTNVATNLLSAGDHLQLGAGTWSISFTITLRTFGGGADVSNYAGSFSTSTGAFTNIITRGTFRNATVPQDNYWSITGSSVISSISSINVYLLTEITFSPAGRVRWEPTLSELVAVRFK